MLCLMPPYPDVQPRFRQVALLLQEVCVAKVESEQAASPLKV